MLLRIRAKEGLVITIVEKTEEIVWCMRVGLESRVEQHTKPKEVYTNSDHVNIRDDAKKRWSEQYYSLLCDHGLEWCKHDELSGDPPNDEISKCYHHSSSELSFKKLISLHKPPMWNSWTLLEEYAWQFSLDLHNLYAWQNSLDCTNHITM